MSVFDDKRRGFKASAPSALAWQDIRFELIDTYVLLFFSFSFLAWFPDSLHIGIRFSFVYLLTVEENYVSSERCCRAVTHVTTALLGCVYVVPDMISVDMARQQETYIRLLLPQGTHSMA
jgi:hypothetical protein